MKESFSPNWVSPPSDTIKDILKEKNISNENFIEQINLGEIIGEKLLESKWRISKNIAIKLSTILGSTPEFWIKRDRQYWRGLKKLNKNE